MKNFLAELPFMLMSLPIIIISLSFHEAAHAFMANKLGDPTAKNLGRLSLNPIKHLDPIGFLCLMIFRFGWAKPVPINSRNFAKPRRDMALSALAGPVSNLLLALVFGVLLKVVTLLFPVAFGDRVYYSMLAGASLPSTVTLMSILTYMLELGVILNISLAVFNLIPINPLDGSRILYVFLPPKAYFGIMRYEKYIYIVFIVLLALGVFSGPISFVVENVSTLIFKAFNVSPIELNAVYYYLQSGFGLN